MDMTKYKTLRKNVLGLPAERRFALLQELLLTFSPETPYEQPVPSTARQDSYAQIVGLLATDQPLSDEDVEQILYEEKLKQHGLEEYL